MCKVTMDILRRALASLLLFPLTFSLEWVPLDASLTLPPLEGAAFDHFTLVHADLIRIVDSGSACSKKTVKMPRAPPRGGDFEPVEKNVSLCENNVLSYSRLFFGYDYSKIIDVPSG